MSSISIALSLFIGNIEPRISKLLELISELKMEMTYMDGAMEHIKSHLSKDKDGRTIEEPIKASQTVYTDLRDGMKLIHQIIEEYNKI